MMQNTDMHTQAQVCAHTHTSQEEQDFPEKKLLALKDLKKLSARKQGRVAERGRSGRERGILGSEPGGPSVTGWLRGATGAHIN